MRALAYLRQGLEELFVFANEQNVGSTGLGSPLSPPPAAGPPGAHVCSAGGFATAETREAPAGLGVPAKSYSPPRRGFVFTRWGWKPN